MPSLRFRVLLLVAIAVTAVSACDRGTPGAATVQEYPPGYVVDSALPIDTLLARFRATLPDTPSTLVGGEVSPERLTRALLGAISAQDTATIRRLVLNRSEFGWLYYPHTRYTRRPYELGPDLLWIQVNENSEKGIVRLLRRYGGSRLRFEALACPDSATVEGPNTITGPCTVTFAAADSAARTLQIFGSIIARDGRHKFVSYANEL
ncbi:hypothetical protein Strain138_002077 [Pseudogemmatithrix spongiicola]|uniref:Lipoprotein n=1 Tax=Pseudogemmatithrix spongiicola TaxID=3062599 RepID=A0AA49Q915_9BACT|nr:hypothetical protein Strain138_002077 [Gemmatimonadaceae bacterium 'strain 138']WKW15675.1 hypothetical protein Strain318_002076 [Gemmatimonadaceae bacterium 'strain 318']